LAGEISLGEYTNFVYTFHVKNITFSADDDLIEQARNVAKTHRKTLNDAFREWLTHFVAQAGSVQEFDSLMSRFQHIRATRHFSRDELNER
jgi:hypothetical protein